MAGAFGLFTLVATLASLLLTSPLLRFGLGSTVGFSGNAVFTPLEELTARSGLLAADGGYDWYLVVAATVFLAFIALLVPWLPFIEEEIFRGGLEEADLRQEVGAALRFGLVHLVMLVPIPASAGVPAQLRQASGVLASTVWHATFNSLVLVLLWLVVIFDAAAG